MFDALVLLFHFQSLLICFYSYFFSCESCCIFLNSYVRCALHAIPLIHCIRFYCFSFTIQLELLVVESIWTRIDFRLPSSIYYTIFFCLSTTIFFTSLKCINIYDVHTFGFRLFLLYFASIAYFQKEIQRIIVSIHFNRNGIGPRKNKKIILMNDWWKRIGIESNVMDHMVAIKFISFLFRIIRNVDGTSKIGRLYFVYTFIDEFEKIPFAANKTKFYLQIKTASTAL